MFVGVMWITGCTWIPQKETLVVREVVGDDEPTSPTSPTDAPGDEPPAVQVSLGPDGVGTDGVVVAEVVADDPDGDELTVTVQWRVNGRKVEADGLELDGGWFDRDDLVELEVTADDGAHEVDATASLVVANTAPGAPTVIVDPPFAAAGYTPLVCRVVGEAVDADGDGVTYDVRWEVDGALHVGATLSDDLPGDTVPGFETDPGQRWTCTVTASDGADEGGAADAWGDVSEGLIVDGRTVALAPGNHVWDVVEVVNGGVLAVEGEVVLESRWVHVDADSVISGSRGGWAGGNGAAQDGAGPGGGGGAANDGGSGGGHGGAGGRGGRDDGGSNTPGLAYGAQDALEAPAGSGGGGRGGAGGAGLWVVSDVIRIEGSVFTHGEAGVGDVSAQSGGGGGAGGTVLLQGDEIVVHGTIGARGGSGGDGDQVAGTHDGGGGGGGGRIKLVYDAVLDIAGAEFDVEGGARGTGSPNGEVGEPGTIWTDQAPF